MKKFLYIGMVLVIAISLAACGSKTSTNATTKATTNVKTTYTKELKYLPEYSAVKATSFTAATKKAPLATIKYTIKNTTDTKVYNNYESILKNDGWTITEGKKYFSISSKKDKHIANVLIQKSGKDIILIVLSK